jgi:hypothetical protein
MLANGESMSNMYDRLLRVMYNGEYVGTIARIHPDGLCTSGAHVFVKDGKFLSCTAFGSSQPLSLIGSIPYHDIIFVQGGSITLAMLIMSVYNIADPVAQSTDS